MIEDLAIVNFSKKDRNAREISDPTGTELLGPPWPVKLNDDEFDDFMSNLRTSTWQYMEMKKVANSSNELGDSSPIEDMEYARASNVCVSSFVTVKLSGKANYKMWKAQMECLMTSQDMIALVDEEYDIESEWCKSRSKKIIHLYKSLLKGWLMGSVSEQLMQRLIDSDDPSSVWITLKQICGPDIDLITEPSIRTQITVTEDKSTGDIKLNKKLRDAIIEGHWWKTKSILKKHKDAATLGINKNGDTVLHFAVREGNNYLVKKLLSFIENENHIEKKNLDHHTCLHVAAIVGNTDAAKLLVEKRKTLLGIEDDKSGIPLDSAYSYGKVDVFLYLWEATAREGLRMHRITGRKEAVGMGFLSTAVYTKQYELAMKLFRTIPTLVTCVRSSFHLLTNKYPSDIGFGEALFYPSLSNECQKIVNRSSLLFCSLDYLYTRACCTLWAMRRFRNNYYSFLWPEIVIILLAPIAVVYPVYQLIRLLILAVLFPCFTLYFLLWKVFAFVVGPINRIEKKKNDYNEAKEFLKWICDQTDSIYYSSLTDAVRLDNYEVVHQILDHSSEAIHIVNNDGHNIIQLAVINRSENVYNLLLPIIESTESYRKMKDSFGNNLLHLAGRLAPSSVLDRTTGAALQLQRELQWRMEVEKLMGPGQLASTNVEIETPEMVFTREHVYLVKEGEKWMKSTAESCSISAALIVTIVFAAAITVPGGNNQDTGIPLFKKEIAFTVFAVSDAISLFTAVASLLVFLSILTTRFSEQDFLISLPRRLLIGLCLLFISTTAMMLAFCAILFLVFCDQRPWMLAPIGGMACLPLAVIVTLQLPLVVDLYQSTYSHIFGINKIH